MCRTDWAEAVVQNAAAPSATRPNFVKESFVRMQSLPTLCSPSRFRRSGHGPLVQRLDLLPRGGNRTFLPAAVAADGSAAKIDPMIGFGERGQPIRRVSAAAAAGECAQAV